jgi:hypothetical protein
MGLTNANVLSSLDHDQVELLERLVEGSMRNHGISRAALRAAMAKAKGQALWGGPPASWSTDSAGEPLERSVIACGRRLLRVRDELHLPLESLIQPSAETVLAEMLA